MPLEGLDEARLAGPSLLDAEGAKVVDDNRANFISKCTESFDFFDGGLSQLAQGNEQSQRSLCNLTRTLGEEAPDVAANVFQGLDEMPTSTASGHWVAANADAA